MSLVELASTLKDLNCRSNFNIQNVTEYMLPETKEAFYVHQQSQRTRLIIRPAFEIFSAELSLIDGVHSEYDYFHNSQMTRFPKRQNKGVEPVHYGLAFTFDDAKALTAFVGKLSAIVKG
jgi:hypothetical protein